MNDPAALLEADPPWRFKDSLPGAGRGAVKHYACMPTADICAFPLPPLADDCLLLMWRVGSMQRDALDVVDAWGFSLKSEIVWIKTTKRGKRHFGMGHYVRYEHETCLIATRGKPKILTHRIRSTFRARVGQHSEKPDRFYRIAEQLVAGPRASLFSRKHRDGWTCFGNELTSAEAA